MPPVNHYSSFCCGSLLSVLGVSVLMTFHFMFVHKVRYSIPIEPLSVYVCVYTFSEISGPLQANFI